VELFKQPASMPRSIGEQILILWTINHGFFDDIPLKNVLEASTQMLNHCQTTSADVLDLIISKKELTDELNHRLEKAISSWKQTITQAPSS
jgi:F-type H+-transporting ATPase subunit alpha